MKRRFLLSVIVITILTISGCKAALHVDLGNYIGKDINQNEQTIGNGININNIPFEESEIEESEIEELETKELGKDQLPFEQPDDEQLPTQLDIVKMEYRAFWKSNYNYNTPIKINDLEELKTFTKNHPVQLSREEELLQDYGNEFFEENIIYAYIKSEGSSSIRLTTTKAEIHGDTLKLFMERISPEVGTCDMATRICLFGINREDIRNVKEVEGVIENK